MSLAPWFSQIQHPAAQSRKGQNGKALIIGGSDLFHAASQWSFRAASRWVDMLFYSSVHENNQLLIQAKLALTDGVVVRRSDLPAYLEEVQSVLIGPGMRRDAPTRFSTDHLNNVRMDDLSPTDWDNDTRAITSVLLRSFSNKTWVIDAGALQIMERAWLPAQAILTPHAGELRGLLERWSPERQESVLSALQSLQDEYEREHPSEPATVIELSTHDPRVNVLQDLAAHWAGATLMLKGAVDLVVSPTQSVVVTGGNAGLTKGGTGDVLAGLILGLVTTSPVIPSVIVAAATLKQAAHELFLRQQEMFNASDVADQLPKTFANLQI